MPGAERTRVGQTDSTVKLTIACGVGGVLEVRNRTAVGNGSPSGKQLTCLVSAFSAASWTRPFILAQSQTSQADLCTH